ncbi:MAG: hypothetical protein WBG71_11020 [Leeuwenhoekiella sp.]
MKIFPVRMLSWPVAQNSLILIIDRETAVVLMTHSYAQDLQWLLQLHALDLAYLGKATVLF